MAAANGPGADRIPGHLQLEIGARRIGDQASGQIEKVAVPPAQAAPNFGVMKALSPAQFKVPHLGG
jgi:hypothetical protein